LQSALLISKQRALREQVPTGLRLIPDSDHPTRVSELVYVQQPDDFTLVVQDATGRPSGDTLTLSAAGTQYFATSTNADFYGGFGPGATAAEQYPVQPGDYLEVNGGLLAQITGLNPSGQVCRQLVLSRDLRPAGTVSGATTTTKYYRIIRQPRRLAGENSVKLPQDVVIDVPPFTGVYVATQTSKNIPRRSVNATTTFYEIVFAPSGGVVGKGTTSGDKIMLWVRDASRDTVWEGEPLLVTVQIRTGMIATHPVDVGNTSNPFHFAQDASSSGL
jgi:hypothetical protein